MSEEGKRPPWLTDDSAKPPHERFRSYEKGAQKRLHERLVEKTEQAYPGKVSIKRVRIVGYGSMTIEVEWFGRDVSEVLLHWIVECLREDIGAFEVGHPASTGPATTSVAGGMLAVGLASIPKSPLTLLFALIMAAGAWLWNEARRTEEALVERRTALIEKLVPWSDYSEKAYEAAFAALSSVPLPCKREDEKEKEPVKPSPPTSPRASTPSCCQQLTQAIAAAASSWGARAPDRAGEATLTGEPGHVGK